MKAFNNARERDAETWASLFSRADPRFHFVGITIPPEARMAIILAEWLGEGDDEKSVDEPLLTDNEDARVKRFGLSTVNGH